MYTKLPFRVCEGADRQAIFDAAKTLGLRVVLGPGDLFAVLVPDPKLAYQFGAEVILHLAGSRGSASERVDVGKYLQ
jgi:hypothetical protein